MSLSREVLNLYLGGGSGWCSARKVMLMGA